MKIVIKDFSERVISPSSTLRTILLFGKNTSTYKFALADTLLKSSAQSNLRYSDLRDEFLRTLYAHYQNNPSQYQAGANSLTNAFDQFTVDNNWDNLIRAAEPNIYNNVFDAFHNVGGSSVRSDLILFEHDKKNSRIVLTENIHRIIEDPILSGQLSKENQSRWRIVEEAWRNKLSPNLLEYDNDKNVYSLAPGQERVNLRSAVDVLLPYQHSKCFYCNKTLNPLADSSELDFPDVDHVIPYSAFNRLAFLQEINSNGMWNLVLACHECNRGANGKFNSPPDREFYDKLISRNVLFTVEHKHSLKNTILLSIGASSSWEVQQKMNSFHQYIDIMIGWKPMYTHHE